MDNAFTDGITGTIAYLQHLINILADFFTQRPILGAVLLSVLVCIVGWEATHPPKHPEEKP